MSPAVSFLLGTNGPQVITRREESATLPFKKCKFVNATAVGESVKIRPATLPFLRLGSQPPYYLRLLSNTKNQIKYAKLGFLREPARTVEGL